MPTYKFESDIGLSQIIKDVKQGLIAEFKSLLDGKIAYFKKDTDNYFPHESSNQRILLINKSKMVILHELLEELMKWEQRLKSNE